MLRNLQMEYSANLKPGDKVIDHFTPDGQPASYLVIVRCEEVIEGWFNIKFNDGTQTRAQGDERWALAWN